MLTTHIERHLNEKSISVWSGRVYRWSLSGSTQSEGYWVRGVDIKEHEYRETVADDFLVLDLRSERNVRVAFDGGFDEVYQLAADMGGAGYIFTGEHDADVMHNSAMINLNVAKVASECEDMPVILLFLCLHVS